MAAFAITPYGAIERPWKPFNPILGETFELECGNNVHFLAEQANTFTQDSLSSMSRCRIIHPLEQPMQRMHISHTTSSLLPKQNSSATRPTSTPTVTLHLSGSERMLHIAGRTHIKLKKSGEIFSIIPPTSRVCNLIIGRTWVDTFGPMHVINVTTGAADSVPRYLISACSGDRVDLDFTPCGWFSSGRYEFDGVITVADQQTATIFGLWNAHCDVQMTNAAPKRLWTCAEKPADDSYGRTYFCYKCSSCSGLQFSFAVC